MKRLVLVVVVVVVLAVIGFTGCAGEEAATPTPVEGEEIASSCVACHTDKETLQAVASPEEEETSEATSGEG